jgi:hypothetical protein
MSFSVLRRWQSISIILAVFAFWVPASVAQTFRGGISGSVTDPSGAAIVGATVQAGNDATGSSTVQYLPARANLRFRTSRSAVTPSRFRHRVFRQ